MMSIDIKYNYLIEDSYEKMSRDFDIDNRIDPDSQSQKLYDDIISVYFSNDPNVVNWKQQYSKQPPFYTIKVGDTKSNVTLLSADYIGPSVYWASQSGVQKEKIIDFLKKSRTIGGHIVWERGLANGVETVNIARAGDKGVYDRIDWTLFLLREYLNTNPSTFDNFYNTVCNLLANEYGKDFEKDLSFVQRLFNSFKDSNWINSFAFDKFCEKFKLCGSFVSLDYKVVLMESLFPVLPNKYDCYIDNVVNAIERRNSVIMSSI